MQEKVVIVGAGSAGCVLANRLSASSKRSVVLVEAGPDYAPDELPHDLLDGGRNSFTQHDWGYRHRPNAGQMKFPLPRGRVVGGSSAVNTCIALRGQPEDYDAWADRGLEEWDWERCLEAFKRLETDLDYGDDPERGRWHGDSGPLPVRRHTEEELSPWQTAFVEGCRRLGYDDCPDSNEPGTRGVGPHAMNKLDGRRISAADAWLTPPVRARDNLTILSETLVHRVLFDRREATGLEVEHNGEVRTIDADRVILSAGAINTPRILMRSGVGPARQLEHIGVEQVAANEQVGARLLDHPGAAIFLLPKFGSGTSRNHDLIQSVCRFSSSLSDLENDVFMQPGAAVPIPRFSLPAVSIMIALNKPHGSGELKFESASPTADPVIESHLLEHPKDREAAMDALERALEVTQTPECQELARIIWPPVWELRDRDQLEQRVLKVCDSGYHPCGTVPMGGDDDPRAACDGHGRVHGVEKLHVVDASLIPEIPAANIHLTVLMIGERMSRLLAG